MAKVIQAIRGMNDTLPDKTPYWQVLEDACREVMRRYAYREIRFPVLESTALFKRSIGEVTDIVEKEMYTFDDRNGDSLTLRPEGTAGCVRAGIEHGLLYNQIQRLWYMGPMFRHERPQKGRYRQFNQLGVEAYGMVGPDIDAEVILLSQRLLHKLGLKDKISLQLNTLGTIENRKAYRAVLVAYLEQHKAELDEDSQRRLSSNPLRILDSKNPAMQELIEAAPKLMDYLDEDSLAHFTQLKSILDQLGVVYEVNTRMVRGLDYYGLTVFEWVTDQLGAQGTVCAGGRYDVLVEMLGGKPTPAVGFACGLERLQLLLESLQEHRNDPDIFIVMMGDQVKAYGLSVAEKLRDEMPSLKFETNLSAGGFKSQFKRADKSGARYALVIAEQELADQTITLKDLRGNKEQQLLTLSSLITLLQAEES